MRKTMMILTALAAICLAVSGTMLTSCDKIDEMEGMNDNRAYYSYKAQSNDFDGIMGTDGRHERQQGLLQL